MPTGINVHLLSSVPGEWSVKISHEYGEITLPCKGVDEATMIYDALITGLRGANPDR